MEQFSESDVALDQKAICTLKHDLSVQAPVCKQEFPFESHSKDKFKRRNPILDEKTQPWMKRTCSSRDSSRSIISQPEPLRFCADFLRSVRFQRHLYILPIRIFPVSGHWHNIADWDVRVFKSQPFEDNYAREDPEGLRC